MAAKRISRITQTAFHEAGHAVIAVIRHRLFKPVTIVPNVKDQSAGELELTYKLSGKPTHLQTLRKFDGEVLVFMAGGVTVEYLTGKPEAPGTEHDKAGVARRLLYYYPHPEDIQVRTDCYNRLLAECRALVKDNLPTIEAVAEELLKVKRLSSKRVRAIYRATLNQKKGGDGQGQREIVDPGPS